MFRLPAAIFLAPAALAVLYAPGIETLLSLCLILFYILPLLIYPSRTGLIVSEGRRSSSFYGLFAHLIVAVFNLYIIAGQVGGDGFELLSWDGIQSVALKSTALRYGDGDELASGSAYLLAINFFLAYWLSSRRSSSPLYFDLICLLPFVAYSVVTTAKFPAFVGITFFIAGRLDAPVSQGAQSNRLRIYFRYGMFLALVGVSVLVLSMLNRGHGVELIDIYRTAGNYLLSQYFALGTWLIDFGGIASCCNFGFESFAGPLDYFRFNARVAGIYDLYVNLYGQSTNIFTAWRFVIEDFSILGPLYFNSLIVAACFSFDKIGADWFRVVARSFFFISAMLVSMTGLFVYNSVLLAFIFINIYAIRRERTWC